MSTRTIEHPGVEITESDQSLVSTDYQMLTALVIGYANKGEDLVPETFSDINSYLTTHGEPTTDAEIYAYNAVKEVLATNGNIVFAKLPYDNIAHDHYRCVGFDLTSSGQAVGTALSAVTGLFGESTSATNKYFRYINVDTYSGLLTSTELDGLRTQNNFSDLSTYSTKSMVIVDVARDALEGEKENEGTFVVVLPVYNAIPYYGLMDENLLNTANPCSGWAITSGVNNVSGAGFTAGDWVVPPSASFLTESISKDLARQFPAIQYIGTSVDRTYLNQVVVLVCKTYSDSNNSGLLNYSLVEKFVGSLYRKDKNPSTGQSVFIGDIINANSDYIELYVNADDDDEVITNSSKYASDIVYAIAQNAGTITSPETPVWPLLGFGASENIKNILYTDITAGMNTIFAKLNNIDEQRLDVVVDAGLSNIAQYISNHPSGIEGVGSLYDPETWDVADQISSTYDVEEWRTICSKFITFCSETRKDCMAILDGPRALALEGNLKIVRSTKPNNTVDINIIPKLRYLMGLNSSYAAMYITWMKLIDDFSGNAKWIPESIKAIGRYCYTEANYNFWEAPYGLERGLISGITDLSFNPNGNQEDSIYLKNFNYAKEYPYDGFVIQGQKTLQAATSAFDRVNVRRLFLKMERTTYDVARYFVGRINNFYTRSTLIDTLDPKFSNVKSLGGIYDYRLVCDETNNTAEVIDNKELKVAIMIKPSQAADYILAKFTALKTSGVFEEVLVD